MTNSTAIAGHLPYLRRFARAITGSGDNGDAFVAAALEAFIADPQLLGGDGSSAQRAAIYRACLNIWNTMDIDRPSPQPKASGGEAAAIRNLAISPLARQAFLLSSVEGFTSEETATILGTDAAGVARLIDQAGREIASQISTDVLVIEDEPLIAMDLATIVTGLGHRIAGRARTRAEAVEAATANPPGLVLADIELADRSSGLDAVNDILGSREVPIIFVTAYPEKLLTGQRPEPTFLIAKPFEEDAVKAIVSQALFFDERASLASGVKAG
ncbi:MAG: response regulator [Hyphomicrobiaceae bacterium]|nr:MAG: response regulator [Hyphomicrobiaceae bacterium]